MIASSLLAVWIVASCSPRSVSSPVSPDFKAFEHVMNDNVSKFHVVGASLVISRYGKVIYSKGFGIESKITGNPVDPNKTTFRYGSLSKGFTGLCCLKLLADGKIDFDRPFVEYFTPANKLGNKYLTFDTRLSRITIRQLLRQTSGLRPEKHVVWPSSELASLVGGREKIDRRSMISWGLRQPLESDPGQMYSYANINYLILGAVIEKVSGQSYVEYVRNKLLKPSSAESVFICSSYPKEINYNRAIGYNVDDQTFTASPTNEQDIQELGLCDASGGWEGTCADLNKIYCFGFGMGKTSTFLTSNVAWKELLTSPIETAGNGSSGQPANNFYSCGFNWWVSKGMSGNSYSFNHSGMVEGFECWVDNPMEGIVLTLTINSNIKMGVIVNAIANELHNLAVKTTW